MVKGLKTQAILASTIIYLLSSTVWAKDNLTVEVMVRSEKGSVFCNIFSSSDGFPSKDAKAVARTSAKISKGKAFCKFPDIAAGDYAVVTYHDEDNNGKLNKNFLGIPSEGLGVSNDEPSRPPKFDKAKFHYDGGKKNIKINIKY